jgi:hypothetical protein
MTRFTPLWQQAGSYVAQVDRALMGTLWPAPGALGSAATAVANTMNISVPPGAIAVPLQSGQFTALCRWDAAEIVTSPTAPGAGTSRIDQVIAQVRDPAIDGGLNNDFIFTVNSGVAASSPSPPAVPANAALVCQYTVPGGAANLNGVTLTDMRRSIGVGLTFATTAERDAVLGASPPDGTQCFVTGTGRDYKRVAGAWQTVPIVIAANAAITPDAGGNGGFTYPRAFPAGTIPVINAICISYANVGCVPFNVSATGASVGLRRPADNSIVTAGVSISYVATLM